MQQPYVRLCVLFGACLLGAYGADEASAQLGRDGYASGAASYEVWLVDQSNSVGNYGGRIHIFNGRELEGSAAANARATAVIDLGQETSELCSASTGANPIRPHMLLFNSTHTHAILSFVGTGHVVIFEAATREPVSCLRMSAGAGGARQAHAAFPTPDDRYIIVANQNGKLLERINTDYVQGVFEHDTSATLNLVTCSIPVACDDCDGCDDCAQACEQPGVRPDNAPICPVPLPGGEVVVTLRGGGMFVVDPEGGEDGRMAIIGAYDMDTIAGNGCGGVLAQDTVFVTSGGATTSNLWSYDVYALPLTGYSADNPPNTPAPVVVDSDSSEHRDAHGAVAARGGLGGGEAARYVWVADRGLGLMTIYDATTYEVMDVFWLSDDPALELTPDLLDANPAGNRIFVSLRGPTPLTGDPHASYGDLPGLGIFQVIDEGATGQLRAVVPISNVGADGVERADGHGIRVRRL
jgi:hypothetical protein